MEDIDKKIDIIYGLIREALDIHKNMSKPLYGFGSLIGNGQYRARYNNHNETCLVIENKDLYGMNFVSITLSKNIPPSIRLTINNRNSSIFLDIDKITVDILTNKIYKFDYPLAKDLYFNSIMNNDLVFNYNVIERTQELFEELGSYSIRIKIKDFV